ncbi:MAG: hypothetical protein ABI321_09400 [Polyangia bacterium]
MRSFVIVCLVLLARVASAKHHAAPPPPPSDGIPRTPENDEKTKRWLKGMRKHRLGHGMWISPEDPHAQRRLPLMPQVGS